MVLFDKVRFLATSTASAARWAVPRAIRSQGLSGFLFEDDVPDENAHHKRDGSNYDENFIPLHSYSPYALTARASFCLLETTIPHPTIAPTRTKVTIRPSHQAKT